MLPRAHRLHRSEDFRTVIRSGSRSGGRHVVVHLRPAQPTCPDPRSPGGRPGASGSLLAEPVAAGSRCADPSRIGLVVGRTVGGAVVRNRVARRLRAHLGRRLSSLPCGVDIVVRALPSAAQATWQELTLDTDRCLDRALSKVGQVPGPRPRTVP